MVDQETIDRVAAAIDGAEISYSMRMTSLINGVSTFTLAIEGMPTQEFSDNDEGSATEQCYARIREVKQRRQAEAGIAALSGQPPQPREDV